MGLLLENLESFRILQQQIKHAVLVLNILLLKNIIFFIFFCHIDTILSIKEVAVLSPIYQKKKY